MFLNTIKTPPDSPLSFYLKDLIEKVSQYGAQLKLDDTSTVPYGITSTQVSGYFIESPHPTLAVATDKPEADWLAILVHEGCHMQQWIENSPAWIQNTMPDGREAVDWLEDWCSGNIELSSADLSMAISKAKEVELDCEKRVVEKIKKYRLNLDIPTQIQKANAYVQFYEHVGKTRVWYPPGKEPYQI